MFKIASLCMLSVVVCGSAIAAGDPAVGKAKVDAICSECHEKADWAEEDAASLSAKIHDVVSGKFKHKKQLKLTEDEIAGIAAYWTSK